MRITLAILLLLYITANNTFGQPAGDSKPQSGDLSLRIKSINFIENNEFYNPIVEGYTLLGFFLQPELIYTPSGKVSLRAAKQVINAGLNVDLKTGCRMEVDAFALCMAGEDAREGTTAFLEKRKALFKGSLTGE